MKTQRMLTMLAVVAAAALPGLTGVAHALVPPTGPRCTLLSGPDPTAEEGRMIGTLTGGPLVAAGTTMTLTCSIQIGGTGLHSDPDLYAVPVGPSANTVTLPPTTVGYYGGVPTYVCTTVHQVDSAGTYDLYWDEVTQGWSQNPATSYCLAVPPVAAPVDGGIVAWVTGFPQPVVAVSPVGVLADPLQWTCTVPTYTSLLPWTITCNPVSSTPPWTCAAVITGAMGLSPAATVRTSVDCDGGAPEAQTATVSGTGGFDYDWANTTLTTTAFSCTFDDGGSAGPVADFVGFCADPGLARVS
jgi:hypothetical protein